MQLSHGPAVVLHEAFVSGWLCFHHTSQKVLEGRVEGAQHPAEQSIHCDGNVAHTEAVKQNLGWQQSLGQGQGLVWPRSFPAQVAVGAEGSSGAHS